MVVVVVVVAAAVVMVVIAIAIVVKPQVGVDPRTALLVRTGWLARAGAQDAPRAHGVGEAVMLDGGVMTAVVVAVVAVVVFMLVLVLLVLVQQFALKASSLLPVHLLAPHHEHQGVVVVVMYHACAPLKAGCSRHLPALSARAMLQGTALALVALGTGTTTCPTARPLAMPPQNPRRRPKTMARG